MASLLLAEVLSSRPVHLLSDPVVAVVVVLLPALVTCFHALVVGTSRALEKEVWQCSPYIHVCSTYAKESFIVVSYHI